MKFLTIQYIQSMKYPYEDLSDEQFENLIILLCKSLLGVSVQGFAAGPDGGRDAKFIGRAELFPSKAAPWEGIVIIQAKHTNGYNRYFLESDFFSQSGKNTVIAKEIPRIKKMRAAAGLDHYMLFANRRLTGGADSEIQSHISKECNIPVGSIYLAGVENLELFLRQFPVAEMAAFNPIDSPLKVSPEDLAEVVQALAKQKEAIQEVFDPPALRVLYEEKNALNYMTADYAKDQRRKFLKDTKQIQAFLASPENYHLLQAYQCAVHEFQAKIIAHRTDYQTFDKVMEYLLDLLFGRDPILRQIKHKRLTRAVLFYMYWNCDIGKVADVKTV